MSKQRMISTADLRRREFTRLSPEAQLTAMKLMVWTDVAGRREMDPELIAGDLYPGTDSTAMVEAHLTELEQAGFLVMYPAEGRWWIALTSPLRADPRSARVTSPPPPPRATSPGPSSSPTSTTASPDPSPHATTWDHMAVGRAGAGERASMREQARERARERAREEARAESEARAAAWAAVESDREMPERPERPMLLDAPPIGCPEHPDGHRGSCGPCRDARLNRDLWLQQRIYETKLAEYYEQQATPPQPSSPPADAWPDDDEWGDEPF